MNRRGFLERSALLAGALCLDWKSFADSVKTMGKPRLKVGVLSDIHLTDKASASVFRHALEYFRDRGAEAVVVAGDMADWGQVSQLQLVADTWRSVFPHDKAPDGHHVERIFIYGNHDIVYDNKRVRRCVPDAKQRIGGAIGWRKAEAWEKVFHEKFHPIYMKNVKGYTFIGAHFANYSNIPGLADYFDSIKSKLDPKKPFFYIQHMHPKGTCSAPWTWGQDDGESTRVLSQFPNCISLSGHSHVSLSDERTIWQGAFTSVGTASLSYLIPFGGRENTVVFESKQKVPSQMKPISCQDGKQGQMMTIYDDYITLERREFVHDQSVGGNWVIPLPHQGDSPLSFEARAAKAVAPEFGAGAKVTVSEARGTDRYDVEQEQFTVTFPSVTGEGGGTRAFDYEVSAEVHQVDVYRTACVKRVISPHYYLGIAQDKDPIKCVFGLSELPNGQEVRFAVRPVECFGKKGQPIYSDWIAYKGPQYKKSSKS